MLLVAVIFSSVSVGSDWLRRLAYCIS